MSRHANRDSSPLGEAGNPCETDLQLWEIERAAGWRQTVPGQRRDLHDKGDILAVDLIDATIPMIPAMLAADTWPVAWFGLDGAG